MVPTSEHPDSGMMGRTGVLRLLGSGGSLMVIMITTAISPETYLQ
jgi:hypothetical protein